MALRGVKPKAVEKRLKALFFGGAGVGKTTAAIQFPQPYLIDTERGAENDQYVKLLEAAGGAYFFTTDFDEMVKEITSLLTEKHEFRSVIIDPMTVLYNDLCDKAAKSLATKEDPEGMAFGRHKAKADRQIKHLLNLLLRLDMNVIITSHMKKRWGAGMVELGNTFDCYAKLDYLFDLVFEIQKRGKERVGIVQKTRIEAFPEGETFPFNYDEIANRYGRNILERAATVQSLATPQQVTEMKRLVELLKVPQDLQDKWLDKAQAETFAEMPTEAIKACIDHLNKQVRGNAAA
jgi:hypothetical protein